MLVLLRGRSRQYQNPAKNAGVRVRVRVKVPLLLPHSQPGERIKWIPGKNA